MRCTIPDSQRLSFTTLCQMILRFPGETWNSKAYKEYYAIATGKAAPKPKASVKSTGSSSDTSITPPTAAASPRLKASAKGKQTAKESKAKSLYTLSEDDDGDEEDEDDDGEEGNGGDDDDDDDDDDGDDNEGKDDDGDEEDEGDDGEEGNGDDDDEDDDGNEGDDDDVDQEVVRDDDKDDDKEDSEDKSDGKEDLGLNIGDGDDDDDEDDDGKKGDDDDVDQEVKRDDDKDDEEEAGDDKHEFVEEESDEETRDEESFDPIWKTPKKHKDEGNGDEYLGLNVGGEEGHVEEEEEGELYRDININQGRGIQVTLEVEDSHVTLTSVNLDGQQQSSLMSSQFMTSMPNLTLDVANFSEFMQTNQFTGAVSAIPGIVQRYMDQQMNEAVKVAVQIKSDRLRDEAQRENDEFLRTVDENMQKIIKEQVKEQVFAYLMWEDFVYQVEHKDTKKNNEMYYPRNSNAYKEYYAVATGAMPPKPKASVWKTRSSSDTTVTPPLTAAGP
nr:hypothetical protein [Tanacetum cinerariifolium]